MTVQPAWIDPKLHTEQCIKQTLEVEVVCEAFIKKYPKYCKRCGGQGGKWGRYDPSAQGVTSLSPGSMEDFDTCADCVDKGICPLCAHQHSKEWTEEANKCEACGWDPNAKSAEYLPESDHCQCWDFVGNEEEALRP